MDWLRESIIANLLTEFIVVVLGVLFANVVQRRIKQWRYGGWRMLIYPGPPLPGEGPEPVAGKPAGEKGLLLDRELSADTAQRILHDKTELDIYVKGRISPFANVNCDLVTELESGQSAVITVDQASRRIAIHARSPKITLRSANSTPTR